MSSQARGITSTVAANKKRGFALPFAVVKVVHTECSRFTISGLSSQKEQEYWPCHFSLFL